MESCSNGGDGTLVRLQPLRAADLRENAISLLRLQEVRLQHAYLRLNFKSVRDPSVSAIVLSFQQAQRHGG